MNLTLCWLLSTLLFVCTGLGGMMSLPTIHPWAKAADQPGVEFKVIFNNGLYEVYLRPNITPAYPNVTLTAQVTLKMPHGSGANNFILTNVKSGVTGTAWSATSR